MMVVFLYISTQQTDTVRDQLVNTVKLQQLKNQSNKVHYVYMDGIVCTFFYNRQKKNHKINQKLKNHILLQELVVGLGENYCLSSIGIVS